LPSSVTDNNCHDENVRSLNTTSLNRTAKLSLLLLPLLVAIGGLLVWKNIGIYPDEIAYRIERWRYFQDHGVAYGLYALCTSKVHLVPWTFAAPAAFLSALDLTFNYAQIRLLYCLCLIATLGITMRYVSRSGRIFPWYAISIGVIGVAGSSLVMARYEAVITINILFCLCGLLIAEQSKRIGAKEILASAGILFGLLLSLYSHLQGLLFLPLSVFVIYRLLTSSHQKIRWRPICGLALLSAWLIYKSLQIHIASCDAYPALMDFWGKMTFQTSDISEHGLFGFLKNTFSEYTTSFQYKNAYEPNYLAGIQDVKPFRFFNKVILCILVIAVLINVMAVLFSVPILCRQLNMKRKNPAVAFNEHLLCFLLIAGPTLVLFFYDKAHNFYRSSYINFLLALALTILFTTIRRPRFILWAKIFSFTALFVAGISLVINFSLFRATLSTYAGPSISMKTNWRDVSNDIEKLMDLCNIKQSDHSIVVDDVTYSVLKTVNKVNPITYLSLQAQLNKLDVNDVLKRTNQNAVLAHCNAMQSSGIGWPAQHQVGNMCCANFQE
jgi:hypothetical protein